MSQDVTKDDRTIVNHSVCIHEPHKVLDHSSQYSTTLYKTHIREANDVVKLSTRQMSPHKKQILSGGSRMFRGVLRPGIQQNQTGVDISLKPYFSLNFKS